MTLENIKDLATIIGVFITAGLAAWAVFVFRNNSRLERAKWLERLYVKFYEDARYKGIRNLIDSDDPRSLQKVIAMVEDESSEFTDYLNFFEFVSILESNKQLNIDEVKNMFSYYLNSLKNSVVTSKYVRNEEKGFEKLAALFDKI